MNEQELVEHIIFLQERIESLQERIESLKKDLLLEKSDLDRAKRELLEINAFDIDLLMELCWTPCWRYVVNG